MKKVNKILVACDLSDYSIQAVEYAADMAESVRRRAGYRQRHQPAGFGHDRKSFTTHRQNHRKQICQ